MITPRRSLSISATIALSVMIPMTGSAALASEPTDTRDVQAYAERYGVSKSAAQQALLLQDRAGDLEERLLATERDSFAGLWIEHAPEFRIVVAFRGDARAAVARHASAFPDLAARIVAKSVSYSLIELNSAAEALTAGSVKPPFDLRIYERGNEVEVMVESHSALDKYLTESRLALPPEANVRVVASLAESTANIYAGLDIGSCTSGFTVRRNGTSTTGITTAGHCGPTMSYGGTSLPHQWQNVGGPNDAQWHTTPGYVDRNWTYNNAYTIAITSKKTRDQQPIGMFVCHMGQATLYGCGEIVSKSFRPSYIPNATATFIQVSAFGYDLASEGDSGGPWWINNTALGIHSGHVCFVTCNDALYSASNYVEGGLGVTILTSS